MLFITMPMLLLILVFTGHSNSVLGMRIYPQWTPLVDPCDPKSNPNPQVGITIKHPQSSLSYSD